MMTLEYFQNVLKPINFTLVEPNLLMSNDGRIKIEVDSLDCFGSYYDGIWWEEAEYEDNGFIVSELTTSVVAHFGFK